MLMSQLTMPEFEAALAKTTTVIIPFGSVEEHGPHLPLGTDTCHAVAVAERAARLYPVLVAPSVPYGLCRSTSEHPGTLSISGKYLESSGTGDKPGVVPPGLPADYPIDRARRGNACGGAY